MTKEFTQNRPPNRANTHTSASCNRASDSTRPQNPPAAPRACVRRQKQWPSAKARSWATVTVLTEHATSPSVQCNNCGARFCGGATRIREHITGGGAITCCPCDTDNVPGTAAARRCSTRRAKRKTRRSRRPPSPRWMLRRGRRRPPVVMVKEEKPKLGQQSIKAMCETAETAVHASVASALCARA